MSKIIALIVAGGSGSRMNHSLPKQYLPLDTKTIIEHTVAAFKNHPSIADICVVISKDHEDIFNHIFDKQADYCFGGESRQDSVRLGLEYIKKHNPDFVMIHDAARPFIDQSTISKVSIELNNYDGVILAEEINDTIKSHGNNFINKTLDRKTLCAAQTPQAFRYNTILELHQKYKTTSFTDDSSLFEKENLPVKIIFNDRINFKITTKHDLNIARLIMEKNE